MSRYLNQQIYQYLTTRRTQLLADLQVVPLKVNPVLEQLYSINLSEVQDQFYQELKNNCEAYWLEAIEPIHGVLFEYDYVYCLNEQAVAYGIIFFGESNFKAQAEPYSFGYNYGFAALFDAVPGITLTVVNPLAELDKISGMDQMVDADVLKEAYILTASIALHMALAAFTQGSPFNRLIRHSPTHFLLQEHDGLSQPIFIAD